jgi:hypothetical protein
VLRRGGGGKVEGAPGGGGAAFGRAGGGAGGEQRRGAGFVQRGQVRRGAPDGFRRGEGAGNGGGRLVQLGAAKEGLRQPGVERGSARVPVVGRTGAGRGARLGGGGRGRAAGGGPGTRPGGERGGVVLRRELMVILDSRSFC